MVVFFEMAVESSDHLDGLRIALEDSNRVNDLLTQSAYNILRKQLKKQSVNKTKLLMMIYLQWNQWTICLNVNCLWQWKTW